jgi:hypothetical protein
VRLIAGQTFTGGWHYNCPVLTPYESQIAFNALLQLNPIMDDAPQPKSSGSGESAPPGKDAGMPETEETAASPGSASAEEPEIHRFSPRWGWCIKMSDAALVEQGPSSAKPTAAEPAPAPKKTTTTTASKPKAAKPLNAVLAALPEAMRNLTVFRNPDVLMTRNPDGKADTRSDNSNTQFAMLALWRSRRYGVPTERTFGLVLKRFQTSQNREGGWGYNYSYSGGVQEVGAMNCVGLLGLAIGYGFAVDPEADAVTGGAGAPKPVKDWRLLNGFVALHKYIGKPTGKWEGLPMQNLYYLWSMERLGVLYNLSMIGDKDWYRWGAEILVSNQQPAGFWQGGGYHGNSPTIDTCLALLFLKRANLVADLTSRLPFDPNEITKEVTRRLPLEDYRQKTPLVFGAYQDAPKPGELPKEGGAKDSLLFSGQKAPSDIPGIASEPTTPTTAERGPKPSPTKVAKEPEKASTESTATAATENDGGKKTGLFVLVVAGGGLFLLLGGGFVTFYCFADRKPKGRNGKHRAARAAPRTVSGRPASLRTGGVRPGATKVGVVKPGATKAGAVKPNGATAGHAKVATGKTVAPKAGAMQTGGGNAAPMKTGGVPVRPMKTGGSTGAVKPGAAKPAPGKTGAGRTAAPVPQRKPPKRTGE